MLIKEIDFSDIDQYKTTKVIPVFMQYGNECFEITTSSKDAEKAWQLFHKIFFYRFYHEHDEYLNNLFEKYLFAKNSNGKIIFSKTDMTFGVDKKTNKDKAVKFDQNAYVFVMPNCWNNLLVIKKVVKGTELNNFRLFVTAKENIKDPSFKKEYETLRKQFSRKKKTFQVKKGNSVVGHINGLILNDEEKFIKYVQTEFKKKTLLGDILLTEDQEKILHSYMKFQLAKFNISPLSFTPDHEPVFALGLVRFAMKNYNTKGKGELWPYFKTDYDAPISVNNQKYIHELFERIMKRYSKEYSDETTQKIDNITMQSFVADHSANQLFDYLFDFWRLDLGRNIDNLNTSDKSDFVFDTLIDAMEHGTQSVMSHTSLLLTLPRTRRIFKNRIRRILKLMDESFWNDTTINETGNRINHLLNGWIANPKGAYQKEKSYVNRHSVKDKGETLFHSPVFHFNTKEGKLAIILPNQRLIDGKEEDTPSWIIHCSSPESEAKAIPTNEHYNHDKIGCYVEKMTVPVPLHHVLDEFEFILMNGDKELKKYRIPSSKIRFFDEKGKYIDYRNAIVPSGFVTSFSDSADYPEVLGETTKAIDSDGLKEKIFELTKGQIITLEDHSGLQVGQKLTDGLNEAYPINGAELVTDDMDYPIYSQLPKLLFKAEADELNGISLVINGKQNNVVNHTISEFRISDEIKTSGYLINLADYIFSEGLYQITLSFPKMHKQMEVGSFAYIRNFGFTFKGSPYVFKEIGTISFNDSVRIDKNTDDKAGTWTKMMFGNSFRHTFKFNFGERNEESENYCDLVSDNRLTLNCAVGNTSYPIHFDIPALYWKFKAEDTWNTRKPANIALKDFKNKAQKLFIRGPFHLSKVTITTTDDVDIAEEESEIRLTNGDEPYFNLERIYNWFRNNRNEVYRTVYLNLDDRKEELFKVICKSKLNQLSLIGDFENNRLIGTLDIEGDENYTVTIHHNGKTICEDEQVTDKKFCIETEIESGEYEINVYEIEENDDDFGFDVGGESILLNTEPIRKRVVNLTNLRGQTILLHGYQDLDRKCAPNTFHHPYRITNLVKTNYSEFFKGEEDPIYGIWNPSIDSTSPDEMNQYEMYQGVLGYDQDGSFLPVQRVIVFYTDKLKPESVLVLTKDRDGNYGSLFIDKSKGDIISSSLYKTDRKQMMERQCDWFYDDESYFITEIQEVKSR